MTTAGGARQATRGCLLAVVGPSGAGKDSVIDHARAALAGDAGVAFPPRLVTRPPDATERNIEIDPPEFERLVAAGEAALWWRAHGHSYALPAEARDAVAAGKVVVVNLSRAVVAEARRRFDRVVVVQVTAPPDVLARRLAGRGREGGNDVAGRLARSVDAASLCPDLVIENTGSLAEAGGALVEAIRDAARGS